MTDQQKQVTTLLSIIQFAGLIGRTEASVRWMIHRGAAPRSALIAGRRMFKLEGPDGVLAWIDEQFAAAEGRTA